MTANKKVFNQRWVLYFVCHYLQSKIFFLFFSHGGKKNERGEKRMSEREEEKKSETEEKKKVCIEINTEVSFQTK